MNLDGVSDSDTDPEFSPKLKNALSNIPRVQREIFLANRLVGMNYAEIARRTGLSEPEIERHMARAIYKMVKQMHGERLSWWESWF
jgi:RNA polymerase sigma-70 factor (ECF subfamily)